MTPAQRKAAARLIEGPRTSSVLWGRAVTALLRELLAGVEVLPCAPTYTEQQIADACMAAEVPDSKCESVLLALRA